MITANFSAYSKYVTDSLFQWDINQTLRVTGLNLTSAPEIHFSNANTGRAIPRQAKLEGHVVTVDIPNSLLQDPLRIIAHIGIYEGDTFKVVEEVQIPVVPRKRPEDYQIEDSDEELYSFKRLENAIANMVTTAQFANVVAGVSPISEDGNNLEVVDLRYGADGVTYESAGEAVRRQFNSARISAVSGINGANMSPLLRWQNGTVNDGTPVASTNRIMTDPFPLNNVKQFTVSPLSGYLWSITLYDHEHQFIHSSGWKNVAELVTVKDAGYAVLVLRNANETSISAEDASNVTVTGYSEEVIEFSENDGYFDAAGNILNASANYSEKYTSMIPVCCGMRLHFMLTFDAVRDGWAAYALYDADGVFLSRTTITTGGFRYTSHLIDVKEEKASYVSFAYRSFDGVSTVRRVGISYDSLSYSAFAKSMQQYETSAPIDTAVRSVAHRGLSVSAPENTLPAYRLAKKHGFNYVECDVSFTSDGVPVLLHDATIDRTSSGTGSISALTYNAVKALDFGSWFSSAYTGTKIPTFEEFIALCRSIGLKPYVELKAGTEAQIKGLVDTVIRYGMREETTWIAFAAAYLEYVKDKDDHARLGLVVNEVTADVIATAQSLQTEHNEVFIDCAYNTATVGAELCIAARIPMEVWTVNDESTIKTLDPYVSGVTSDNLVAGRVLYEMNI